MSFSIFTQPTGPTVPISLFADAATSGAALGKAIPSTVSSIVSGVQEGLQFAQKYRSNEATIEGQQLQNQLKQNELENQPIQTQLDEAKLRQAETANKINDLKLQTALATQETDEAAAIATNLNNAEEAKYNAKVASSKTFALEELNTRDPVTALRSILNDPRGQAAFMDSDFTKGLANVFESNKASLSPEEQAKGTALFDAGFTKQLELLRQREEAKELAHINQTENTNKTTLMNSDAYNQVSSAHKLSYNDWISDRVKLEPDVSDVGKGYKVSVWDDATKTYVSDPTIPLLSSKEGTAANALRYGAQRNGAWVSTIPPTPVAIPKEEAPSGQSWISKLFYGDESKATKSQSLLDVAPVPTPEADAITKQAQTNYMKRLAEKGTAMSSKPTETLVENVQSSYSNRLTTPVPTPTPTPIPSNTTPTPTPSNVIPPSIIKRSEAPLTDINVEPGKKISPTITPSIKNVLLEKGEQLTDDSVLTKVKKAILPENVAKHVDIKVVKNVVTEPLLDGFPSIYKAVAAVESGGNRKAKAKGSSAEGLFQLTDAAVKDVINSGTIINKKSPSDNVVGGVTYLNALLNKYDYNPVLALFAYNLGMGVIDSAIVGSGGQTDYDSIVNQLEYMKARGMYEASLKDLSTAKKYPEKVLAYKQVFDGLDTLTRPA